MGFSLDKEQLDHLRKKLHVIDELHARAGGIEPVDPKETFFDALEKRKDQGSRSEFSGEDILLKLQQTKVEISEELQEAIQRLQMELNEQFSMLIKEGRSGAEIVQNLMKVVVILSQQVIQQECLRKIVGLKVSNHSKFSVKI